MPALVVEVVGDTQKLTKGLSDAERQLKGFSRRTSTIHGTGADALLADVRALKESGRQTIDTFNEVDTAAVATGSSLAGMGVKAGLAGLAVYTLNQNLSQAGGGLGKFGNAMSSLMTGDFVGFAKKASDNTEELKGFEKELFESHNATKAMNIANKLAAAGLDEWAEAARRAELAIMRLTDAAVDLTKVHDPTSPGAIASDPTRGGVPKTPFKPKPLTPEQRRAFFDARIGREIDRTQDIKTVQGQVAALRKIAGEIQNRIDATKDVTRKLNLEDQLVAVNRLAQQKLDQAAGDAATAAAKAAREREQRLRDAARAAEEARRAALARAQAAQDVALGLGTPSADNLRKQFESLSRRVGDNPASTLQKRLRNVRRILAGEFGAITEETRSNIQSLYDAIRQELDKGAKEGGPLTRTTGLNAGRIVGGLGLSRAEERALRARLSGFNSAGVALAGANDVNLTIAIDGRAVEHSVTKNQQRRARANPPARRGR